MQNKTSKKSVLQIVFQIFKKGAGEMENTNVIQTENIRSNQKVNLNVRVEKAVLDEIELVAGFLNIKRSNLMRALLDFARENATFEVDGEEQKYKKIVKQAKKVLPEDFAEQIQEGRRRAIEENKNSGFKKVVVCEVCLSELHHDHHHHGGEEYLDEQKEIWQDIDEEANRASS